MSVLCGNTKMNGEVQTMNAEQVIKLVLEKADDLERAAALRGDPNGDGGASLLREQVKYFNYGRELAKTNACPSEWLKYTRSN